MFEWTIFLGSQINKRRNNKMIYTAENVLTMVFIAIVSILLGLNIGIIIGYFFRIKQREGNWGKTEK